MTQNCDGTQSTGVRQKSIEQAVSLCNKERLTECTKYKCKCKCKWQRLYELGARRVLVTGTGPLGCVPSQLATRSRNGECVPELQQAAQIFNPLLVQMTRDLNSQVGADVFVAVNAFIMNMDFITNPQRFGLFTFCFHTLYNMFALTFKKPNNLGRNLSLIYITPSFFLFPKL